MKRILTAVLAAALLLTLAACGGKPVETQPQTEAPAVAHTEEPTAVPTAAPTDAPTDAPTEAPTVPAAPADENVLVSNENCAFAVIGAASNEHLGMELQVVCENKTDAQLLFSWDMVSVCGYMYDPVWSEKVEAGQTLNSTVYIDTFALEEMGVASVDEITFNLNVFNTGDWMAEPYVRDTFTVYPTGLSADTVTVPQRVSEDGEQVIVDNDDVVFLVERVDSENAQEYTLRCYLENKTGKNLMFFWDGVEVNGEAADPAWSCTVTAGKRAYSTVSFDWAALEEMDIENVESITFTMAVSDYDDFEADYLLEETFTFEP